MRHVAENHSARPEARRPVMAAALVTFLLLAALCLPGDRIDGDGGLPFEPPPGSDKVVHAGLFFVETRFLRRAFHALGFTSPLFLALGGAMLLAVATEVAQMGIPGRDGSGYDLLADALGAGLYAGILRWRVGRGTSRGAQKL